jgi:WD40 repeat protein
MRRHARLGLFAVAAVLLACGDDLGPRVPAAIAVTPAAPAVALEGTLQLEAAVVDASGREIGGHAVAFASSDTTVLTVSGDGLLTSTGGVGTSLITVESEDLTVTVEAEVVFPPSSLIVRPRSLVLDTEEQGALRFTVTEQNGKPLPAAEVSFRSSDPEILRLELAEFDNTLLFITALAEGSATLTVTSGEMSVEVPVTVGRIPGFVQVTPHDLALLPGSSQQVTAELFDRTGDPLDAPGPFTWASSNEGVVSVSPAGMVTSVGPEGAAVVTATVDTFTDTLRVFVGTVPAGELLAHVEFWQASGVTLMEDGRYFVGGDATLAGGTLPDFSLPVQIPVSTGQVTDIVVNSDGTRAYLMLGGWASGVVVMDLTTNTQIDFIDVNLGRSWAGAISADGTVLTVGTDAGYERFDIATKRSLGGSTLGWVGKITRHPSQPLLYASGSAGVLEIDDRSGQIIRRFPGDVTGHVVTPDAKRLYTVSFDNGIGVWNLETGEQEPTVGSVWGWDVTLSPDGKFLYVILRSDHIVGNSRLYIVDPVSGTEVREVVLGGLTNRITMSPDGIAIITNEASVGGVPGWIDFVR